MTDPYYTPPPPVAQLPPLPDGYTHGAPPSSGWFWTITIAEPPQPTSWEDLAKPRSLQWEDPVPRMWTVTASHAFYGPGNAPRATGYTSGNCKGRGGYFHAWAPMDAR